MIVLQVVLALILGILGLAAVLIALVAAADFTVRAQYQNDQFTVSVGAWPLLIKVWSFDETKEEQPPKKPPTKRRATSKKAAKKVDKQLREQPAELGGTLETLKDLFIASFPPAAEVFTRLRLRNVRLHIHVAEGDAASTAVRYGQYCAVLSASSAAAVQLLNIRIRHLGVSYDFLGRRTTVLFSADVRLRGVHLLAGALKMAARYLRRVLSRSGKHKPTPTGNAG